MSASRAYCNGKRMSTARAWKGKFLQVYPCLATFQTEDEWRSYWSQEFQKSIRFEPVKNTVVTGLGQSSSSSAAAVPLPPSPSPQPSTKGWSYREELTYTAPPGKYYIGDLCYALFESIYDNVFGGRGYDSGFYRKDNSFFMVDSTAYGDGDYEGTDGYHYLVDAGIIGICSADLIDPNNPSWKSGGKVHTFKEPVEIRFKGGIFHFSSGYEYLKIDTAGSGDDD